MSDTDIRAIPGEYLARGDSFNRRFSVFQISRKEFEVKSRSRLRTVVTAPLDRPCAQNSFHFDTLRLGYFDFQDIWSGNYSRQKESTILMTQAQTDTDNEIR